MSLNHIFGTMGDISKFAQEIGPDTDEALIDVVVESYKLLCKENTVKEDLSEDEITLELYTNIQHVWRRTRLNAIPIHQYPIFPKKKVRGRPPTIDFVFIRGFSEYSYFAFECKLVNDKDSRLIREYVTEGMLRFISGKYAQNESIGAMVGYLFNCKVPIVVDMINSEILKKMNNLDCLKNKTPIGGFNDVYLSCHVKKQYNTKININHLFFSFNV